MEIDGVRFERPVIATDKGGKLRSVGFELEFSGITLDQAFEAVKSCLGGELVSQTAASRLLHVEGLGDFRLELDWDTLKRLAEQKSDENEESSWIDVVGQAAALLVPLELVCPPIKIDDLKLLHPVIDGLRKSGAVGTEESMLSAYGVHINAEVPQIEAETIASYLKAFSILQWWLVEAHEVDLTRRVSPYVDLYPEAYIQQLFSRPAASMDDIFSDYLEHNASRNRALDLLPLLAEIDEERVRKCVDDPRIKSRPAFHYRLPNCHIERADWSLANSWNTWCVVERLSTRSEDLKDLGRLFLDADRPILGVNRNYWVEFIDQWLKDRKLV